MQPSPQVIDSRFIRYRSASYLSGKGLAYGCSNDPIVPHQAQDVSKYCLNLDNTRYQHTDILDSSLDILSKESVNYVFVGARENPPYKELISKLQIGGHLIIHSLVCDPDLYRSMIGDWAEWQEKDTYLRDNQFLGVWKLLSRSRRGVYKPKPKAAKRACIARYGAIGDMIMLTPLIKQLHTDGYEVTCNVTPYCADVLKHNPYVSNIVLQERDIIPNTDLGDYWKEWLTDYDKYINLSESIEGKLLKVEGRRDFYTTKAWRAHDINYFDQTMRLGGYPDIVGTRGELFFSNAEHKAAQHVRQKFADKFIIMWALKGSSHHKVYPLLEAALGDWLTAHPDSIAMLVGAPQEASFEFQHPQAVGMCGKMSIRETFCLTRYVDLVGGPESSVTNAAGTCATPKITLLSHSAHNNLCRYWENDYCLAPENIACYPCGQLHYSRESCPIITINDDKPEPYWTGPACAGAGVSPQRLQARIEEVYQRWLPTHGA